MGARVSQGAAEEQQATELVVGALVLVAMQRVNDEDIVSVHALQWPRLVFAILEVALLVLGERCLEMRRDLLGEGAASRQAEQGERAVPHRSLQSDPGGNKTGFGRAGP